MAERSGTHLDGLLILVHERLVDARQQVPAGHDDMRQQPVVRARTVARLVDEVGVVLVMISNCRVAAAAVRHVCGGGLTGLDEILDPRNEGGKEGGATAGGKQNGAYTYNLGPFRIMKNGTLPTPSCNIFCNPGCQQASSTSNIIVGRRHKQI